MRAVSLLVVVVLALVGCGSSTDTEETEGQASGEAPNVVVAGDFVAHLVEQVTGERAEVTPLVPEGVDVRTFEPNPEDAEVLADADVFFESGRELNEALTVLALEQGGEGMEHAILGDQAISEDEILTGRIVDHGTHAHRVGASPILWGDVTYARRYARTAARVLSRVDAGGAADYEANAEAYAERLDALDDAIKEAVGTIPQDNRDLVVASDEWAYFARRYGLELHELYALDPTAEEEDELRELSDELVIIEPVAVFAGPNLEPDVLAGLAEDSGVPVVEGLSLSELPEGERAYEAMMVRNARAIVEALGGDASALDAVDPAGSA